MSTTGRQADVESIAAAIESADFVRVIARADGDSLAASGVLARALDRRTIPFQVSVATTIGERTTRATDGDHVTLVVGASDASSDRTRHLESSDRPTSLLACDLVGELEDEGETECESETEKEREATAGPDPVLALAGAFAAGVEPGAGETEWLLQSATDRGLVVRRPGVAVPTDDLVDGLAYTTQCRAPWSGDLESVRGVLEEIGLSQSDSRSSDGSDPDIDTDSNTGLEDDDHRRLGSVVALDVVGHEDVSTLGATAIGRLLRPYETPTSSAGFATIGGYADVLEATAELAPGLGVALAMGHDVRESALEVWRDHGRRTHAALDEASTGRYDGLFVVGIDDGPVESVARLAAAFRSPEPLVLAIGDGEAAVATLDARPLDGALEAVARDLSLGADYDVGRRRGYVRFGSNDGIDDAAIISAVRETL